MSAAEVIRCLQVPVRVVLGAVLAVLALVAAPAAGAATATRSVAATIVYEVQANPQDPGRDCSAVAFAQWSALARSVSARARYTWNGSAQSVTEAAPFHDTYVISGATYAAPTGMNRIKLAQSLSYGADAPASCAAASARQQASLGTAAQVEVQVTIPAPPRIRSAAGTIPVGRSRAVTIGTVTCPKPRMCRVTVPKRVALRIAGTRYWARATGSGTVRAGKRGLVRIVLPRAAQRALRGRIVTASVRVRATKAGSRTVVRTVKRRITTAYRG